MTSSIPCSLATLTPCVSTLGALRVQHITLAGFMLLASLRDMRCGCGSVATLSSGTNS